MDPHVVRNFHPTCPHGYDMDKLHPLGQRPNPTRGETQDGIIHVSDKVKE
jgi:hypothetical protein